MDSPVKTGAFILFFAAVIVVITRLKEKAALGLLDDWVQAESVLLTSVKPARFWRGPFFFAHQGQTVFRIAAMDRQDGIVRRGWACCGGWFPFSMGKGVVVQWDS